MSALTCQPCLLTARHWLPAGTRWVYNTGNVQLLQGVLRSSFQAQGGDASYWQFPWSRLFKPLGARSFAIPTDAVGLFTGECCACLHALSTPKFAVGLFADEC